MSTATQRLRVTMLADVGRVLCDEGGEPVTREVEMRAEASLEHLARAIIRAFGFDFDHPFGFYSGRTRRSLLSASPRWELFADMPGGRAEGGPRAGSVRHTAIAAAFPRPGHHLIFLFDYGDEWLFAVEAIAFGEAVARRRYPRILATTGKAPPQYPDPEEADEDAEVTGINPRTGERIVLRPKPR